MDACASTASLLHALNEQHKRVSERTAILHANVRGLSETISRQFTVVQRVSAPLAAYHSLYIIGTRLGVKFEGSEAQEAANAWALAEQLAAGPVGNLHKVSLVRANISLMNPGDQAEFAAALDRMDECVTFLASHVSYKDAPAFLSRYRQLQARALQEVRAAVQDVLQRVSTATHTDLQGILHAPEDITAAATAPPRDKLSESNEMSLLHVRYRMELMPLRPLLALLESRAGKRVYADAARDCYAAYCDARARITRQVASYRLSILAAAARHEINSIMAESTSAAAQSAGAVAAASQRVSKCLLDAVRSASAVLARLSNSEYALFSAIFLGSQSEAPGQAAVSSASAPGPTRGTRAQTSPASGHDTTSPTSSALPTHLRNAADALCNAMLEDTCAALDVLRPLLMTPAIATLDTLCDVVQVLREEVLGELAGSRGPHQSPLGRAAMTLLRDCQERATFLAESFIVERTERYAVSRTARRVDVNVPITLQNGHPAALTGITVHGDLDYPAWMVAYHARARSAAAGHGPAPSMYDAWFPVVEHALTLLSKLYRVVEPASFDALTQDCIAACTQVLLDSRILLDRSGYAQGGLQEAGRLAIDAGGESGTAVAGRGLLAGAVSITRVVTDALEGSSLADFRPHLQAAAAALDGDLFVIKNLLVLREQLSPFDVQTATTAKSLDFSSTTQALSTLVSQASHVFSLSKSNPLLSFITTGLPRVAEKRVDCKQELEALLKSSCERFIMRCRELLAMPLESAVATHRARQEGSNQVPATADAAEVTAFVGALEAAQRLWPRLLIALRRRVGLYMGSAVTSTILFRPVRDYLQQLLTSLRRMSFEFRALAGDSAAPSSRFDVVDANLDNLRRILEASDEIAAEPSSVAYGYDDAVVPTALGPVAGAATSPSKPHPEPPSPSHGVETATRSPAAAEHAAPGGAAGASAISGETPAAVQPQSVAAPVSSETERAPHV